MRRSPVTPAARRATRAKFEEPPLVTRRTHMVDGPDAPARVGPAPSQDHAEPGTDDAASAASSDILKARKKRDKLRAAWIAFAGRILAQLIGAIAAVVLGVYVVRTYGVDRTSRPAAVAAPAPVPAARPASPGRPSLVVLPFQSFSSGARGGDVSDGLTEALIADLSRTADLRVISRTSSMFYKGTSKPVPVIARELNVDLVVEGSVTHDGERVRVTVQLIDASTDTHVWAKSYDRTARDVLALQAEVTRAIAQELHAAITPHLDEALAAQAGIHPEAYDRYLRGRHAFNRRSPADLAEATTQFVRVIALAPAHAALATTWCLRALDAFGVSAAREALDRAEGAAHEALRLDPSSADAHLALAMVLHRRDWDWAGAEREFIRAFDLHESHATAHQWYSIFLAEQGRHEQAQQQAERAIALDPNAAPVHRTAGLVALYARRHRDAEASLRRSLDLDPTGGVTRLLLASVLIEQGRHADAGQVAALVRDPELQDQRLSLQAQAAARARDRAGAVRYRDEALALPGDRSLVAMARFDAALGDTTALLTTAAKAVDARTPLANALKVHPVFEAVRGRPEFQALMRKVGVS
jgi:TolB-like protein/Tfp pilus assembly protein PilF